MFKFAASLAVASVILAAPGLSTAAEIARPLHARLIAPPTFTAFADAGRLVVGAGPVTVAPAGNEVPSPAAASPARVVPARPLHARLIAPPAFAAHADASRMVARTPSADRPIQSAAIEID